MSLVRRHRLLTVFGGLAVGAVLWFIVLRPCWTYRRLATATSSGERDSVLEEAKEQGPVGRQLARRYARRELERRPDSAYFFILRNRDLWIGMSRGELHEQFGTPDEVRGDADIWYVARRYVLQRLKWNDDSSWDVRTQHEWWFICLAAEYEDGVLVRLGDPMRAVRHLPDIEQSPYQTRLKIDVDPSQLDTPPPEWLAAKEGKAGDVSQWGSAAQSGAQVSAKEPAPNRTQ